jgi:hypothetical protein
MSVWKNKYKTIREYYYKTYDQEFYHFDDLQLAINPDETIEDIEQYSVEKQTVEVEKCVNSFSYFCQKYVRILHPTK